MWRRQSPVGRWRGTLVPRRGAHVNERTGWRTRACVDVRSGCRGVRRGTIAGRSTLFLDSAPGRSSRLVRRDDRYRRAGQALSLSLACLQPTQLLRANTGVCSQQKKIPLEIALRSEFDVGVFARWRGCGRFRLCSMHSPPPRERCGRRRGIRLGQ